MKKVTIIVLDSVGIGELPDAADFDDCGSNTLANIANSYPDGLHLPNLQKMGLGNIHPIKGIPPAEHPIGNFGKCKEGSKGKDTTTGHWEIAGIVKNEPFPVYPEGFPDEIIKPFEKQVGVKILFNKPASGTEIINKLGDEHLRTKKLIVYTSADSVFQIAAHEELYPPEELYRICEIARKLLTGKHSVARVIARPFIGTSGNYQRTTNRRDFSLPPPEKTLLDFLVEAGESVIGIGKIGDIFEHIGLTQEIHTTSNANGIRVTIDTIKSFQSDGLIFTNLVDFDMLYGHRNDVEGYKNALMEFDRFLPEILDAMSDEEILILTADHGCDPTTPSTDHSREYIPLLVYGRNIKSGVNLGTRELFSDIGQTVAEYFGSHSLGNGKSFLKEVVI